MKQIAIYSPIQVFAGAFLGGPIAAVYLLWENFKALGKELLARQTIIWGSVLVLAIVASLPFLPENLPNAILPAIFGGVAMVIASQFQMKKQEIREFERVRIPLILARHCGRGAFSYRYFCPDHRLLAHTLGSWADEVRLIRFLGADRLLADWKWSGL